MKKKKQPELCGWQLALQLELAGVLPLGPGRESSTTHLMNLLLIA